MKKMILMAMLCGSVFAQPMAGIFGNAPTALSFGPATINGGKDLAYQFGMAKLWDASPNAAIKVAADGFYSPDADEVMGLAGIGLDYYLLAKGDVTPYLSPIFGFGSDASNATGFGGGIGAGLMMFRGGKAQLFIEGYAQSIFKKNAPTALGVKLGLKF